MDKSFNYFVDDEFLFYEARLKGETESKFYVEGYASTIDPDLDGETIEYSGQADLVKQMQGRNITLDLEHNTWFDENNQRLPRPTSHKIPVGKVVSAELKSKGAWIKVEINKHLTNFKEIWGSIKSGFLHAFSVGYVPKVTTENGKHVLSLVLHNVAITGTPVNPNATFNATLKSASAYAFEEANLKGEATFNGKSGKWRTVNGKHLFFSDDGGAYNGDGSAAKGFGDKKKEESKSDNKKSEYSEHFKEAKKIMDTKENQSDTEDGMTDSDIQGSLNYQATKLIGDKIDKKDRKTYLTAVSEVQDTLYQHGSGDLDEDEAHEEITKTINRYKPKLKSKEENNMNEENQNPENNTLAASIKALEATIEANKNTMEAQLKAMNEKLEMKDKEINELKTKLAEPALKAIAHNAPTTEPETPRVISKTASPLKDIY